MYLGVIVNFPVRSQGIVFAIIELIGGLVNFSHIPIIENVKSENNYDSYNYFIMGLTVLLILPGIILYLIGKQFKYIFTLTLITVKWLTKDRI